MQMKKNKPVDGRIKISGHTTISLDMIEDMITMAESYITDFKKGQQELTPDLEKHKSDMDAAYEQYLEYKGIYDEYMKTYNSLEEEIKKKKNIIVLMNHIKTGKPIDDTPIYEKISNNVAVKVRAKKSPQIDWVNLAARFIKEMDKFYDPITLVEKILGAYPEIKKQFESQARHDKTKIYYIAQNLVKTANRMESNKRGWVKILHIFNNKIGHVDFFDWNLEHNTIKPQYIKQFINS